MQYLLLIAEPEEPVEDAVLQDLLARHMKLGEDLVASGMAWSGNRLKESHTATTIAQGDGGKRTLHDGPYAETREQLGGYYLIEAADLDEALAWANKIPLVDGGKIEVRPVWGM
jgi:hypothetical protein